MFGDRLHSVAALALAVVSCGGEVNSGSSDAGRQDAASDQSLLRQDGAGDVTVPTDTGQDVRSSDVGGDAGKPPYDGGVFASCATNPCGAGQVCADYLPTPSTTHDAGTGVVYGTCLSVAKQCEPAPTCFCLLETAECSNRMCNDDGGVPVLTCTITPPP
jgi:hypothetical protein